MTNYSLENGNRTTTNEISEKKQMPKFWSCFIPQSDEKKKNEQINKHINAKLKQDERIYKATYRLLLLGLFIFLVVFLLFELILFKVRVNQGNQQL